jgi:hypothetical protein
VILKRGASLANASIRNARRPRLARKKKEKDKDDEPKNENDKWITETGSGKTKKIPRPKLAPKLHNAFAILSKPNTPTIYNMSGPALQMDDGKTIIPPNPLEHCRQCKLSRRQHSKQMLRRLRDSDDMFLDNTISVRGGQANPHNVHGG